ncbi:MAG: glucokinase [Gammaproteobacteria bacterium]
MTELTYTLLADVGGTHTRCAVANEAGVREVVVFDNKHFESLESVLRDYVARQKERHGSVDEVILGVAGPVTGDHVALLNLDWSFSASDISRAVDARQTRLVNDFEALAYSLASLPAAELSQCGGRTPSPYATKVVLGPGTGLGVSSAVWTGSRWLALPGEGGHVSLAATNEREVELCRYLRHRFGHASAERALSGAGLSNIHHFVTGDTLEPVDISKLATSRDKGASESFGLFFALLGSVASNLALTLGAAGGVYVAGGVAKKNMALLNEDRFRRRFENKGRYSNYLARIPVYWIKSETPALAGLYYLRHHAQIEAP